MPLTKNQKTVIGASVSTAAILIPLFIFFVKRLGFAAIDVTAARTKDELEASLERREARRMLRIYDKNRTLIEAAGNT